MAAFQKNKLNEEENFLSELFSRFLPFWPLYVLIALIGLFGAWTYLKFTTPIYEASATLLIKDENKGVDDAKMMEAIDPFDSKKIVENEIEVIQSRSLMDQVTKELHLYAPVMKEKSFGEASAYSISPISIELKDPDNIPLYSEDEPVKFYFTYNANKKSVLVNGKEYPTDEWVTVADGSVIKYNTTNKISLDNKSKLYYTLYNPRLITDSMINNLLAGATTKLSTVVKVTFRDPDPKRGEDILNALIHAYNQKAVDERNKLASNTLSFIEERMNKVKTELDDLEQEIQEFRSTKGAIDLSEQGKLYLQDMGAYDRQISSARQQIAVLDQVENYIQSNNIQGGIVPSSLGVNDPALTQLLNKLYDSEIQYEKLRKTTGENNPILSSVANEIKKIRPSILENVQNQKSNLEASLSNLNRSSGSSRHELTAIPEKEKELLEITRRKAIKGNLFAFLQQKREETALTYAPSDRASQVVDLAQSSFDPVSPNRTLIYLMALAFSLALGILYVIVKEFLNRRILFRSEIERYTSIPIIAEIPNIEEKDKVSIILKEFTDIKKTEKKKGFKKTKELDSSSVLVVQEQALQDHFRQLGASLGLYSRSFTKKSILATSSISGEGKSFVCANLANCIAKSGKRVVLVDVDFIRPNTTKQFNLLKNRGVLDYLRGKCGLSEVVNVTTINKNLSVVPVGLRDGEDHTDLLLNGKLDLLFEYLKNKFDFVIMDAPPIDLVADVNLLAEYCDESLLMVRHGHTPKQVVKHFEDSHILKRLKSVSIVFNGIKKRGALNKEIGYGYGYSNKYGHAYEYMPDE
ncbi:AAA family ATPase [Aurantibacter crassamenti]|uniref:GumC family protein n=1 Tax=Aurantibacter crassamenti TaxID=1837375 RepID=UPI00193A706B|nr:AAA family ATPase [Aurantibacter crassamenti]MBM1105821.1 AAA family ATPase [Aurantibacter crassamenti]